MKEKLQLLLLNYLKDNNPDLLFELEEADAIHAWILEKIYDVRALLDDSMPSLVVEAECMEAMTASLKPSKYLYLKNILEDEFAEDYQRLLDTGVLTFEVVGMIASCKDVFEEMPLTQTSEEDNMLRYAATGVISDYLKGE